MQSRQHDQRFELLAALATGFALMHANARLMTAESCTGGMVSHWLTSIAGSSHWFDGGVVTYANVAKVGFLGVKEMTLRTYGAVSAQTAFEMADGLRRHHRRFLAGPMAHVPERLFSLSVTGVAGPQGGQPAKPVGTVFFGWAGPAGVDTEHQVFDGDRGEIQRAAALWALSGLVSRVFQKA